MTLIIPNIALPNWGMFNLKTVCTLYSFQVEQASSKGCEMGGIHYIYLLMTLIIGDRFKKYPILKLNDMEKGI